MTKTKTMTFTFSRRRAAGAALIGALALFGTLGPAVIAADPAQQDLLAPLAPPGGDYLLGTDHYGRSLLARLAHATRLSLGLAVLTVLSAAIPGTLLGIAAAWAGGIADRALGIVSDMILALPGLLLVLLLAAFAPGQFLPLYLGLALAQWVEYFRVTRATARTLLSRPHVEASRLLGFGPAYIRRVSEAGEPPTELVVQPLITGSGPVVQSGQNVTFSFIGVGLHPPTAEWGSMATELLPYYFEAPFHVLMPAAMILLTVLGFHLLAGEDRS